MFERTSLAPLRSLREHCVEANQIAIESQDNYRGYPKKEKGGTAPDY